jgi:LysM repeat protein
MPMPFRRMLPFLFLNVIVSATVVLSLLYWWDGRQTVQIEEARATSVAATAPAATHTAVALAQLEPEPEPTSGPLIHTVRAGDTLGNISQFYNVPLADIVEVNQLANPNVLQVGQQLIIPVGGIPTPTPEPSPTPTVSVLPSPIATEPWHEGSAELVISEVVGAGLLTEEAVTIANLGTRPLALLGWKLQSESGHVYTFGQITLFGEGAAILVHTEAGRDGPSDLYWGLNQSVWKPGDTVTLVDSEGTVQATYGIPDP